MKNWHGIMKILEVEHVREGEVIWSERNINNLLHTQGEFFVLSCAFDNDGAIVPANYYFGLDARPTVAIDDIMADLVDEPSTGGYSRQLVSSNGGFTISQTGGIYRAVGAVITFTSAGAGYGPVNNLFLTNQSNNAGYLISTAVLSSPITLTSGASMNLRMAMQLSDISA